MPKDTRFKPGQSGNPNGRPKDAISVVTALKRKLLECPEGMDKKTYLDLLVSKMLAKALKDGDVAMIRDIINRIDGLPKQTIDQNVIEFSRELSDEEFNKVITEYGKK